MDLDASAVSRWIETLANRPGDIAEVFLERRWETVLEWRDGDLIGVAAVSSGGVSARLRRGGEERLAFSSRPDESGAREAVRALAEMTGRPPLPIRPERQDSAEESETPSPDVERWRRRLLAIFSRQAPRHGFRWSLFETSRQVIPAREPASSSTRRRISLEGSFIAASRRGDEERRFSFHAPDADATPEELRMALAVAATPREQRLPCGDGETDVVLANGCAAVLFHEILSHPLESGGSPLSILKDARLAVPDLEVKDDPNRLDLFGGYERDDEGTRPRPVKLLDAGRLVGQLTDRARAGGGASNGHARRAEASDAPLVRGSNIVVAAGGVTTDEMARRLGNGLWIEEISAGSIELASGRFRLSFPRARRVRRGRTGDEVGPGILAGEILSTLKRVEGGMGRQARPYRALGWCSRAGQVVPVQGAAPDILIRQLSVRSST